MAKSKPRKRKDQRKHHGPSREWVGGGGRTFADRTPWLRLTFGGSFDDAALERYDVRIIKRAAMAGQYEARVPVTVPVYLDPCTLHITIDKHRTQVIVEGFPGNLRHTFGENKLCMWFPSDLPERRWTVNKGLLALIEMALVHLFRERYVALTGEPWPGEEAPHPADEPKADDEADIEVNVAPTTPPAPSRAPTRLKRAA
jgi:hypothetical protein